MGEVKMEWNHAICYSCYSERYSERIPGRIKDADWELCCFCRTPTHDGIYFRSHPIDTLCRGYHYGES